MNPFWSGILVGGIISPFLVVIVVWAIFNFYPVAIEELMRRVIRKLTGRFHLSRNPVKGLKRKRMVRQKSLDFLKDKSEDIYPEADGMPI